jgi:hypothetical protein
LAQKISLLILKVNSPVALVVATGFIGGLASGLAALSASYLHSGKVKQLEN